MARTNKHIDLYVSFYVKDMESEAFQNLSKICQWAIFMLDKLSWQSDRRNPIPLSQKFLADFLGCDPKTAQKILTELDDNGFLVLESRGKLRGKPQCLPK